MLPIASFNKNYLLLWSRTIMGIRTNLQSFCIEGHTSEQET